MEVSLEIRFARLEEASGDSRFVLVYGELVLDSREACASWGLGFFLGCKIV